MAEFSFGGDGYDSPPVNYVVQDSSPEPGSAEWTAAIDAAVARINNERFVNTGQPGGFIPNTPGSGFSPEDIIKEGQVTNPEDLARIQAAIAAGQGGAFAPAPGPQTTQNAALQAALRAQEQLRSVSGISAGGGGGSSGGGGSAPSGGVPSTVNPAALIAPTAGGLATPTGGTPTVTDAAQAAALMKYANAIRWFVTHNEFDKADALSKLPALTGDQRGEALVDEASRRESREQAWQQRNPLADTGLQRVDEFLNASQWYARQGEGDKSAVLFNAAKTLGTAPEQPWMDDPTVLGLVDTWKRNRNALTVESVINPFAQISGPVDVNEAQSAVNFFTKRGNLNAANYLMRNDIDLNNDETAKGYISAFRQNARGRSFTDLLADVNRSGPSTIVDPTPSNLVGGTPPPSTTGPVNPYTPPTTVDTVPANWRNPNTSPPDWSQVPGGGPSFRPTTPQPASNVNPFAQRPASDLFRARGGPMYAGQPYIVGEYGPEVVRPGVNSQVNPFANPPANPAHPEGYGTSGLGGDRFSNPPADRAPNEDSPTGAWPGPFEAPTTPAGLSPAQLEQQRRYIAAANFYGRRGRTQEGDFLLRTAPFEWDVTNMADWNKAQDLVSGFENTTRKEGAQGFYGTGTPNAPSNRSPFLFSTNPLARANRPTSVQF